MKSKRSITFTDSEGKTHTHELAIESDVSIVRADGTTEIDITYGYSEFNGKKTDDYGYVLGIIAQEKYKEALIFATDTNIDTIQTYNAHENHDAGIYWKRKDDRKIKPLYQNRWRLKRQR